MSMDQLITTILTSTAVTSALGLLFRVWLEHRLRSGLEAQLQQQKEAHEIALADMEHRFQDQLEHARAEMNLQNQIAQVLMDRRVKFYSRIVELVYRIRNTLRGTLEQQVIEPDHVARFKGNIENLEEMIFCSRFDLERDRYFEPVHRFKNDAVNARNLLLDLLEYQQRASAEDRERVLSALREQYQMLDAHHTEVVGLLSSPHVFTGVKLS